MMSGRGDGIEPAGEKAFACGCGHGRGGGVEDGGGVTGGTKNKHAEGGLRKTVC
jgi:hypothetical protein